MLLIQEIFTPKSCIGRAYFVQSTAPSRQNFILVLQELPVSNIKKNAALYLVWSQISTAF